jgi:thioredoxin reductase (NADPH)
MQQDVEGGHEEIPSRHPLTALPGWPPNRLPLLLEASLPGVFAAGDVRHRSIKRVASAVGEGSIAIQLIHDYLGDLSA